ncbi:MAG: DUF3971 domain-containing protein, partial [Pseudomonadota bacterium]
FSGMAPGFAFDQAKTYFTYQHSARRLDISTVSFSSELGTLAGQGYAVLQGDSYVAHLQTSGAELAPLTDDSPPLDITSAGIDMRLRPDPFKVEIGAAYIQSQDTTVRWSGSIQDGLTGLDTALDANVDRVSVDRILAYWPAEIRPGFRQWLSNNVTAGTLNNASGSLRKIGDGRPQLYGSFGFSGAQVQYLRHHPPISGGTGQGQFDAQRLALVMEQGRVITPDHGTVTVAGSSLIIPNLSIRPTVARFDLDLDGPTPALLWALDQRPLRLFAKANRDFALATGRAAVNVSLALPFKKELRPSDVAYVVDGTLHQVRSTTLVPNQTVTANRLRVQSQKSGTTVDGTVQIAGTQADITWRQVRGTPGSRLSARALISDPVLRAFNIGLPQGMISGRTPAQINVTLPQGGPPRYAVTSNLVGARVAIDAINWTKAAGTAADFSVSGHLGPSPSVEAIALRAPGLRGRGQIRFQNNRAQRIELQDVQVANWLTGAVTLTDRGAGRPMAVDLSGARLDLRRLPALGGGAGGGTIPPLAGTFQQIIVSQGLALTNA